MSLHPLIVPPSQTDTPEGSALTLEEIGRVLGRSPGFFLAAAHSPVALRSLWAQFSAAGQMALPPRLGCAIALRVAELHGCSYSPTACGQLDIDEATASAYRRGISDDPVEQGVLGVVTKIVKQRGQHAACAIDIARAVGVSDTELIETVALIALNSFVCYLACLADTEIDCPPPSGGRRLE